MVGGLHDLSPADRERIASAVAAVQARTRARFVLVVVPASDRYHLYPVVWGSGIALAVFGVMAAAFPQTRLRFAFALVAVVFTVASLILEWRPLRMLSVPQRAKKNHANALARREFAARVLSHPGHEGVLFFVSLAERYAEVIADRMLHEAAGQAAWDKIVADFTRAATRGRIAEGFVAGVEACGALLERHRPKD